jgi:hypothetical protein
MSKRAIIILSASIKKDKNGNWSSTDLKEKDDKCGAPGGKQRLLAAKYLYEKNNDYFLIATGGRGNDVKDRSPDRPDLCRIIKNELIELGIPENIIYLENRSNTTFEQLQELKKNILKLDLELAMIISNKYHLPRLRIMIDKDPIMNSYMASGIIKLVSAEAILIKQNPEKWGREIKTIYESDWMKIRIKNERQGVRDLKNNKYKF